MEKKMKGRKKYVHGFMLFLILGLWTIVGSVESKAAEIAISPSADIASAPEIAVGSSYYATMDHRRGFVSFVTPAQGGYVTVFVKNISISDDNYTAVKTVTEEILDKDSYTSAGSSVTWYYRSEPGLRNKARLEPNTRYYVEIGNTEDSGNVLFSVSFQADANPDGKEQAEEISLNKEYTRSIDSDYSDLDDHDYFKFTTGKRGGHRLTISRSVSGKDMDYEVRKWSTDELAKTSDGSDAQKSWWSYSSIEQDITLEANTTYYLAIWSYGKKNYTFSINNQSVTGISVPATAVLGAGESFKLNPVISPSTAYNKEVSYSSSNEDIAWVNSDGTVHASSSNYGTTVITVKAKDGSGVTATCRVTVRPATPSTPYISSYTKKSHTISWNSQYGVSGYEVYVKQGKKWKALKKTTSTSIKRTGLKGGQKFQYRIRSYIGNGQYSGYSRICYAATAPAGKVKKIRIVKYRKKSSSYSGKRYYARISWSKVKGATSYQVTYRYAGSTSKYTLTTRKKRSCKTSLYVSKYSSGKKTLYYYVKPIIDYHGKSYSGSDSKGKKYRFH